MITMFALSSFLVLLWVFFYFTTRSSMINNMVSQAETTSDVIIRGVENELLTLNDTAYALSHFDKIISMASARSTLTFYDEGLEVSERADSIIGNYCPANNVVVFNHDGLFYRIKGEISNTALKRAYFLLEKERSRIFTVSSNNTTYIGCMNEIMGGDISLGYVVLLMERSRFENLLNSYADLDYLGTVITADGRIICSNKDVSEDKLGDILAESVFYKEKEIGLSGFNLIVYCENAVSDRLSNYFKITLPLAIVVLLLVMAIFVKYWRRHIIGPIYKIIVNTNENKDRPLPLTGEEYFDDLVIHVNDTLKRIEDRDKALFDADMKIKESELQNERTLISLLKKQIGAHFTVNTLNAVRALINKGEKEEAVRICNELSGLIRYANAGEEYISLFDEFHALNQYASIMQTRYPERFEFETVDDDAFLEIMIPRMLLQPIVENSIIHGFTDRAGKVTVSATIDEKDVFITVEDNGSGMKEAELKELRQKLKDCHAGSNEGISRIALINIERRIRMVCGERYGLYVESEENKGCTVMVRLPLQKK